MKFIIFFVCLLTCSFSFAFKISPIELNFETKGRGATQTVKVENTTKNKIPVEITAYERVHIDGKEKRVPTNDFYYFPKQMILKPGEKRNIRLTWMGLRDKSDAKKAMKKGNTKIKTEKPYRLEVKQVPVDLKKSESKTGISFLYNYVASLYVKPSKTKASLKVNSYKKSGKNLYKVSIENDGSSHAILSLYNLVAKKSGQESFVVEMKGQGDLVEGVNLLPGEKRSVEIKIEDKLDTPGLNLEFAKRK
jgi:fimbrial chaperone protein